MSSKGRDRICICSTIVFVNKVAGSSRGSYRILWTLADSVVGLINLIPTENSYKKLSRDYRQFLDTA